MLELPLILLSDHVIGIASQNHYYCSIITSFYTLEIVMVKIVVALIIAIHRFFSVINYLIYWRFSL